MPGPISRSSRLAGLLGLAPEELPPVVRLALVYGTIGAAVAIGDATVQAIFIARAGADRLPEVLIARALITPAIAFLYARFARPRAARSVLALLTTLAAAGALLGRLLIETGGENGALSAYVIHEVLASIVTVHWGVYLLANLRGDHALRGTPAVYAAARLGAALGGAALAPLVEITSAGAGLYATAGLFFLAALFAAFGRAPRADSPPLPASEPPPPMANHEASAKRHLPLSMLLSSPLLGALALATAAMVFVRFTLRYQQQALLEPIEEHELAQLLAIYTAVANGLGVVFQLGLLGRILSRIGLTTTNTFYAIATLGAQVALLLAPGVPAALGARFADGELKHAIKTPLSSLFYEAFPSRDRGAVRAAVLGFFSPLAQVIGALGLAAAVSTASLETLGYVGLGATLLFGAATLFQNRAYNRAPRS